MTNIETSDIRKKKNLVFTRYIKSARKNKNYHCWTAFGQRDKASCMYQVAIGQQRLLEVVAVFCCGNATQCYTFFYPTCLYLVLIPGYLFTQTVLATATGQEPQ